MNSKILKLIEQRLLIGEKRYGHQNITTDGRDFEKEALEEALDCAVYLAAKLIEIQDSRLINVIKESDNGKSNRSR